jgi:16S rRNA A1518/A1519 N6-dimethyltransferase RsmA/KsgA/DIM1 with predicted DNA glycosylase/AP lyase activity
MDENQSTKADDTDRRFMQNVDPFIAEDLHQMEQADNYNKWLYDLVQPYIGKRILEIGPGIGTFSKKMISEVDLLVGVEPNQYCADQLIKNLENNAKFILINKNWKIVLMNFLKVTNLIQFYV